ncbi:hypothetical protein HDV06_000419 [Boothiomyces sp. JEL0866]|nr:hypothetical protein HDV06_000419 [Boothiomyces sp. JEL0866]
MDTQPPPITREEQSHLNQLVRDLVQGDATTSSSPFDGFDQIPYIVKQVLQSNRQDAFSEYLTSFIQKKEIEIEKMCGLHYQEFVQSVDQLLKVRQGTSTIKDKIVGKFWKKAVGKGLKYLTQKWELIENRQKLVNVELTLESVQSCLFVLDITNRIAIQIVNKKVKDGAIKIGKLALDLTNMRQEKANEILNSKGSLVSAKSSNMSASIDMAMNEEYDMSNIDTESSQLDFTPLLQCIHIHDVLGKRVQLKLEFDESRKLQSEVILTSPIASLKTGNLAGLERYIQEITGFFVIEATVIATTVDFRSKNSVETLWLNAANKMNANLYQAFMECTNPDLYLSIKMLVNSFIQTMEVYGYTVTSLSDLMVSLLDQYADLMKSKCTELIMQTINEEDDYSPMIIKDADELDEIMSAFQIPEEILNPATAYRKDIFPKILPFSKGFPQTCRYIRELIFGFYKFADGFSQQSHEIDDLMKKTLENLLLNLNSAYHEKIESSGISVVNQLMINIQYFTSACTQFEDILQERKNIRVTLSSARSFAETKAVAEKRMLAIIQSKCASFLDLIEYEWQSNTPRRQASPFLNDLIGYLNTVMSSTLAELPSKPKGVIYLETFDYLSVTIKGMILNPALHHLTLAALETVEYDVLFLDNACKKLQDNVVQDAFTELKQLIAYGKSERYEDILNPNIKAKKYSRLDVEEAALLLDKLRNFDTSWFSQSSSSNKQLKANIENVLKAIRK